jgi:TolB-like protein
MENGLKKSFGLAIIIWLFCSCTTIDYNDNDLSLDAAIEKSVEQIAVNISAEATIAVVYFESESEKFSAYIMEELAGTFDDNNFKIVDRSLLEYIRREMNYQLSGEVSDENIKSIGHQIGAQFIITGQLVKSGNRYRFRLNAINVESSVREICRFNVRNDREFKNLFASINSSKNISYIASYGEDELNLITRSNNLNEIIDIDNLSAMYLATIAENENQLLKERSNNELILETGKNYICYAEYFIEIPGRMIPRDQHGKEISEMERAKDFYLKGLAILEKAKDVDNDVRFLYWKSYGVYHAYALDPFDFFLGARIPECFVMVNNAYRINPDWEDGKLDELLFDMNTSLPQGLGGDSTKAYQYFSNSIGKSKGLRIKPFVLNARNVTIPKQDNISFREMLNKALSINPFLDSKYEVENRIYQNLAQYLLDNIACYFIDY